MRSLAKIQRKHAETYWNKSAAKRDFNTPADNMAAKMFYEEYVAFAVKKAYMAGIKATAKWEGLNGVVLSPWIIMKEIKDEEQRR
jgi:hypothetical protein